MREHLQRIVTRLSRLFITGEACFALTDYLHHASMPACDGHHGRGLSGINTGARIEDFLARHLQFHLDLTRIEQGFGAFQRIG